MSSLPDYKASGSDGSAHATDMAQVFSYNHI